MNEAFAGEVSWVIDNATTADTSNLKFNIIHLGGKLIPFNICMLLKLNAAACPAFRCEARVNVLPSLLRANVAPSS